jgi:hypothetical protein
LNLMSELSKRVAQAGLIVLVVVLLAADPLLAAPQTATAPAPKSGLADPRACRFDPAAVQCKPGQDTATCLSPEQVEVARQIYRGAHDANGRQLVIGGPQVGSELAWPGVQVPRDPGRSDKLKRLGPRAYFYDWATKQF